MINTGYTGKTRLAMLGVAIILACSPARSTAAVALVLPEGSAIADPGGFFSFSVYLDISDGEQVTGYDYYLRAFGSGYDAYFTLTDRSSNTAGFPDLNYSDAAVATLPYALLSPVNGLSLGASVNFPFVPISGPGSYHLATFDVAVSPFAQVGEYTIQPVFAAWFDQTFDTQLLDSQGSFTLHVVPEPRYDTWLTLALGLAAIVRWTWRRLFVVPIQK
jgi:hypothetical protein